MSVKRVDSLVPHPRILETLPLAGALSETLVGTLKEDPILEPHRHP